MIFVLKECPDCHVVLDEGQQQNVDDLLDGVWPTKCFKCGKDLVEL